MMLMYNNAVLLLLSVWRNYPSPHYTRRIFFYDPQMTKYGHIGFTIDSVSNGFVYRIPLRWIVNGQKRVFFCEFKHIERRKKNAPSHSPSPNQMWHETTNSIGKFLLMVKLYFFSWIFELLFIVCAKNVILMSNHIHRKRSGVNLNSTKFSMRFRWNHFSWVNMAQIWTATINSMCECVWLMLPKVHKLQAQQSMYFVS